MTCNLLLVMKLTNQQQRPLASTGDKKSSTVGGEYKLKSTGSKSSSIDSDDLDDDKEEGNYSDEDDD